ncbi:MAG: terpene cyclase/mutase family protein [Actinobacteria bacterium]|nr:terpene cyclase/mutase family protein [Actinomycetota bacterium]
MSRRIWLGLAVVVLVAVSFAASGVAARRAGESRPKTVTRGLDYLHARQADDGGFGAPANTAWAILGAVASGERMGSAAWTKNGKNPFEYLQATNHEQAATSAAVDNAPVYYARMIMAYVAVGRRERVFVAGTPHIDLLAKLYTYQDMTDGAPTKGSFSPSSSTRKFDAVHTTSWAVLAMHNFNVREERFTLAETWLADQQLPNGGFASESGKSADCLTTALAIQALTVGSDGLSWDPAAAREFLKDNQNSDGGFPVSPGGRTNAEATAAAIQAIIALGERPDEAFWRAGPNTPIQALAGLQRKTGAYRLTSRDSLRPLPVTAWAVTAMNRKSFSRFPRAIGPAVKAFKFRPTFRTVSPKNGAKFTNSRVVLIKATYTDFYPKGTGISPSACRLYVDGKNKSGPADIGNYGLRLLLKDVPNGDHTFKIELRDRAGNVRVTERKFTVAVATPTHAPTVRPTFNPAPVVPTSFPTQPSTPKPYPTTAPPVPTLTPTPYSYSPVPTTAPVVTGSPLPSPSTSPSPGDASSADGGSAAGFVGGTLLAMLPIGAVASYLLLHRREELLGTASQGTTLSGGGSPWERFKQTLAKSKDLTRPSSRE